METIIEYSSNNSGGGWWLSKQDWLNLEKAGWVVVTGEYIWDKGNHSLDENGFPKFEKNADGANYLRAYAKTAYRKGLSLEDAIKEFEEITGQDVDDEGCECCGNPHNFYVFNNKYMNKISTEQFSSSSTDNRVCDVCGIEVFFNTHIYDITGMCGTCSTGEARLNYEED